MHFSVNCDSDQNTSSMPVQYTHLLQADDTFDTFNYCEQTLFSGSLSVGSAAEIDKLSKELYSLLLLCSDKYLFRLREVICWLFGLHYNS